MHFIIRRDKWNELMWFTFSKAWKTSFSPATVRDTNHCVLDWQGLTSPCHQPRDSYRHLNKSAWFGDGEPWWSDENHGYILADWCVIVLHKALPRWNKWRQQSIFSHCYITSILFVLARVLKSCCLDSFLCEINPSWSTDSRSRWYHSLGGGFRACWWSISQGDRMAKGSEA